MMHERLMKSTSALGLDCSFALTTSQSLNPTLILTNHTPRREGLRRAQKTFGSVRSVGAAHKHINPSRWEDEGID